MSTEIHDPGGLGFVITEVYAYLAVHDDGDEAVAGATMPDGTLMPLIAADPARLEALRPYAEAVARLAGKRIRLVRFTTRTDIETIEP